jgi:hypothetical protein
MMITDRIRSPAHMAYIKTLPCSVRGCRREPVDVHHLTCSPEPKAHSLKADDNWTVPLVPRHAPRCRGARRGASRRQ